MLIFDREKKKFTLLHLSFLYHWGSWRNCTQSPVVTIRSQRWCISESCQHLDLILVSRTVFPRFLRVPAHLPYLLVTLSKSRSLSHFPYFTLYSFKSSNGRYDHPPVKVVDPTTLRTPLTAGVQSLTGVRPKTTSDSPKTWVGYEGPLETSVLTDLLKYIS